jgi:hypothetical protein
LFFLAKLSIDAALCEQHLQTENGTNGNSDFRFCAEETETANFPFVSCKWKREKGFLFSLVGKL